MLDHEDPSVASKFTLRRARGGRTRSVPSSVHGAPLDAEESRETLGRLKRMAGFESQDFDPVVSCAELSEGQHGAVSAPHPTRCRSSTS
jgi:chloride channel 7